MFQKTYKLSKNTNCQLTLSAEIGIEVKCSFKHFRTFSFVVINMIPVSLFLFWYCINMNYEVKKMLNNCRQENMKELTTLLANLY